MAIYYAPFLVQGLAMLWDEFYFHRKRGLPLWEIVGHPLDSLTVFASYFFISVSGPTSNNLRIYIALCVLSCLVITKDEFVHKDVCSAAENWLHSVLFVVHPICFLSAGLLWMEGTNVEIVKFQPYLILSFMVYQIIYWSNRERRQQ